MPSIFYNTQNLVNYCLTIVIFSGVVVAIALIKWLAVTIIKETNEQVSVKFLIIKIVKRLGWFFSVVIAADVASHFLWHTQAKYLNVADKITLVVGSFYILLALGYIIDYICSVVGRRQLKLDPAANPAVLDFFSRIVKFLFWVVGLLTVLSNFGYNINALLTGLGIGGIAVAFALQNILTDIFASVSIHFDQPFKVGDFIIFGSDMGTVSKIGIRSTRLQTLEGQELIVSNRELTSLRINNYKRMTRRRIVFDFGVPLATTTEQVQEIPDVVKNIIKSQNKVSLDRVHFSKIDSNQFLFEAVYFIDDADYNFYMDTQQAINLAMVDQFRKHDINLAYPAQTVFVRQAS